MNGWMNSVLSRLGGMDRNVRKYHHLLEMRGLGGLYISKGEILNVLQAIPAFQNSAKFGTWAKYLTHR